MIPVLLIVIPLVSGLLAFLIKQEKGVKAWSLLSALATMVIAILGLAVLNKGAWLQTNLPWLPELGRRHESAFVFADRCCIPWYFHCHLACKV